MHTIELAYIDDPVLIAMLLGIIAFGAYRIVRRILI
jgi:hypothetical protein